MHSPVQSATPRLHPLVVTAAASVTLVSLIGAAAILGLFPSSHSTVLTDTAQQQPGVVSPSVTTQPVMASIPADATPTRFQTADGRVFSEVNAPAAHADATRQDDAPVHHKAARPAPQKVAHHAVPDTVDQPVGMAAPSYAQQHPVQSYVSDMSPVGTGLGAVVGGVLGHQVGGGNGKKIATVAGALLGGYAGNEVAHDRNPLPFTDR